MDLEWAIWELLKTAGDQCHISIYGVEVTIMYDILAQMLNDHVLHCSTFLLCFNARL
jgi:hypothetical protein